MADNNTETELNDQTDDSDVPETEPVKAEDDQPKSEDVSQDAQADIVKTSITVQDNTPNKSSVVFAGKYEILPDKVKPLFNTGENKAYQAFSLDHRGDNLLAFVCEKYFVPRRFAAPYYASIVNPNLIPLVSHGKVYWPPAKEERYIFIYKDILGQRIMGLDDKMAMGWKQDRVMDSLVQPLVSILQDFRDKDFVHGSIRPSNMFLSGAGKVILGECLSMQPSYMQPVLFEPIERAQANPISRGKGVLADDIYAFGVTLAVMLRQVDPLAGKSDQEIIAEKIIAGSYTAITGKDRFKGSILELLRGVLHDDPTQRWTIDEIMMWLDGRRLSPKQGISRPKAARPITFNGKKYTQTLLLASDFSSSPEEAANLVETKALQQWIKRSLKNEVLIPEVEEALYVAGQGGKATDYRDKLTSYVVSVLDKMGPIRFRDLKMSGDSVGAALLEHYVNGKKVNAFADLFTQNIAYTWVKYTQNPNVDVGGLILKFDNCLKYLRQKKNGFGLERCLYALNPEVPCLSPKLQKYFVASPEDMVLAFEDSCSKGDKPMFFLDRHSIAYLSVRDAKVIDSFLFDLDSKEPYRKLLANIKCFAGIQKRSSIKALPNLAKAFGNHLQLLLKQYHDKKIREQLKKSLEKAIRGGSLVQMATILDSPEVYDRDFRGFRSAMIEFQRLDKEHNMLTEQLKDENQFGRSTGKEVSAIFSGVIAAIIIAIIGYLFFVDKAIL